MIHSQKIDCNFSWRRIVAAMLFLTTAPLIAHFLFSHIGYNPTDDGFTLAYARRILEGQIPHKDFIIIRPFISPLLHLPVVMFGGDNMYLLSRFVVWLQMAWIAWCSVELTRILMGWPERVCDCFALAVTAFALSMGTWPVMAWHTIDGLFFVVTGMLLVSMKKPVLRYGGYFFVGYAYLCKQSFIMTAPLLLFILGDWRKWKYWIVVMLPGVAYLIYLLASGALPEAMVQFQSHSSLRPIVDRFLGTVNGYVFWVYLALRLLNGSLFGPDNSGMHRKFKWPMWSGLILILAMPVANAITTLYSGRFNPFSLFWGVAGITVYALIESPSGRGRYYISPALMALLTGWSVAVSVGAITPRLASGLLVCILLAQAAPLLKPRPVAGSLILSIIAVISAISFWNGRQLFVYMEQPAANLTESIRDIFPGGNNIHTNPNTYKFLKDMQRTIEMAEGMGRPYAILPDVPGYWAGAVQVNPLSIDWAKNTELTHPAVLQRLLSDIENKRGKVTFLVQKHEAFPLRYGFRRLTDEQKFAAAAYVRRNFKKIADTECFEIYQ